MPITYRKAGVDIKKADKFIERIKSLSSKNNSRVLGGIGGFSALWKLDCKKYKSPVLAVACDGVGTKVKLASYLNKHKTVGIDLVAMNVNDLVTSGASPLLFLDYISTTRLNLSGLEQIIKGINKACRDSGCLLLGGETAQMPQMYKRGEYDLAGFAVGIVEEKEIIDGSKITAGDVILGLESNGLHSNGYSLVRKLFSKNYLRKNKNLFYRPTRIYVKPLLKLKSKVRIKGLAHITGGGFYDNIKRILPEGISAKINKGSWPVAKVFKLIQDKARISDRKMHQTFNMGIGMAVVIGDKEAEKAQKVLVESKIKSYLIGQCLKDKKSRVIM
jgi:phosphoribosylformylglycinamidine cyclo-ligase